MPRSLRAAFTSSDALAHLWVRIREHPAYAAAAWRYAVEYAGWRDRLGVLNQAIANLARMRVLENLVYLHFLAPGRRGRPSSASPKFPAPPTPLARAPTPNNSRGSIAKPISGSSPSPPSTRSASTAGSGNEADVQAARPVARGRASRGDVSRMAAFDPRPRAWV
jgi:hypothetical protein